ncbi:MAG: translesion DNA synthesis-associated protein ImuA [Rhodanobacteraceae bacterium]
MSASLQSLFENGRLWRGQGTAPRRDALPTGFGALDGALPGGGWPRAALSEILFPADGVGEMRLLLPALALLSREARPIILIAPPYLPFPAAWIAAGVDLRFLEIVQTGEHDVLWAAEQCLRSAACAAVLCWPRRADTATLRRLQLAAETGQTIGFMLRPSGAAAQPSMAAVRVGMEVDPLRLRLLKCRGGNPPLQAVPLGIPSLASFPGHHSGAVCSLTADRTRNPAFEPSSQNPAELDSQNAWAAPE